MADATLAAARGSAHPSPPLGDKVKNDLEAARRATVSHAAGEINAIALMLMRERHGDETDFALLLTGALGRLQQLSCAVTVLSDVADLNGEAVTEIIDQHRDVVGELPKLTGLDEIGVLQLRLRRACHA